MSYLNWDTQVIRDFSPRNVADMYAKGYVFTRVDKGVMNKTRSFRIDLKEYSASSENRRILRKVDGLALTVEPIPYQGYSWKVGKLAKDFFEKFGDNVFTANKIKEIATDADKSNFNRMFVFKDAAGEEQGYVICHESEAFLHYSYPFYKEAPSRGLGMMTRAIEWARTKGLDYVYLGSLSRPSDTYKLQFQGAEWFDGERWQKDLSPLKELLKP